MYNKPITLILNKYTQYKELPNFIEKSVLFVLKTSFVITRIDVRHREVNSNFLHCHKFDCTKEFRMFVKVRL